MSRPAYIVKDQPLPPETTEPCANCGGNGRLPGDARFCPDCDGTGEIDLRKEERERREYRDELLRGGGFDE